MAPSASKTWPKIPKKGVLGILFTPSRSLRSAQSPIIDAQRINKEPLSSAETCNLTLMTPRLIRLKYKR